MINDALTRLAVHVRVLLSRGDSDRGATAVEYGLLLALISVAVIVGAVTLGPQLGSIFTNTANHVSSANGQMPK